MRRRLRFVVAITLLGLFVPSPPASAATTTYTARLRTAIANLPVATEVRTGYDSDKFKHWTDGDHDGCDTREEVLIAESKIHATVGSGCRVIAGRWYSYYDGVYWTRPSDVDIDHLVPLAEAWDSGARSWSSGRRQSYANDVGDARSLVAVTDNVNQSKGDQDPAEWLPQRHGAICQYVRQWVVVKVRWHLTVDRAEKTTLTFLGGGCPNTTFTVRRPS